MLDLKNEWEILCNKYNIRCSRTLQQTINDFLIYECMYKYRDVQFIVTDNEHTRYLSEISVKKKIINTGGGA